MRRSARHLFQERKQLYSGVVDEVVQNNWMIEVHHYKNRIYREYKITIETSEKTIVV